MYSFDPSSAPPQSTMEPESSIQAHQPTFRHNAQTEADFFIVMTFDAEFDAAHEICTWLMDAFNDSREKLGFWMQSEHMFDQDGERTYPPLEPRLIASVHPKHKNQVEFCLHLTGYHPGRTSRSSSGRLCCYDFYSSGFVSVNGAGVRTITILEAIRKYNKKQAPPANITSCIVSGIPGDVMKTVWWAMIGEDKGYMKYPMYGIIPRSTVREMSFNFGWGEYPPSDDTPSSDHDSFQEISVDE